jgi:predicted secreted protein
MPANFVPGSDSVVTLNGTDISDWVTGSTIDPTRKITDVTPIGGNPVSKVVGTYSTTITVDGGLDDDIDDIIAPLFYAATPTAVAFERTVVSSGVTMSADVYIASYRTDAPSDGYSKFTMTLAVKGTVTRTP